MRLPIMTPLLLSADNMHGILRETAISTKLLTDVTAMSQYWGQLTQYSDNLPDYFGVKDTGLPSGCQLEQVHLLQRHANRFPSSFGPSDGSNDLQLAQKIANFNSQDTGKFAGPLDFLNTWNYELGEGSLTGYGAATEFLSGVNFWNRYGRTLYNATVGQLAYNASFPNGTARPKPVLRTTGQSRIYNSEINWSLGFFGPSFPVVPNPEIANASSPFDLVIIPEGGKENNTLAAYDSCFDEDVGITGSLGDLNLFTYVPKYLGNAIARMQEYAPPGFTFNTNDTYAMQSICAYETNYLGHSDFCPFFTQEEWEGFENTLDILYYYDNSWGNPTGRSQGIGYVQELIARLKHEFIPSSNSSVNSTLDDNPEQFPLGQPFYADFSHDTTIIAVLTALSLDYFHVPPSLIDVPPNAQSPFVLSHMIPFGSRLITEVLGCASDDPSPVTYPRTQYYPTQYGYDPANATYKFIRMRLNDGILPLDTIRGGACEGRSDGLCAMDSFLKSQEDSYALSNYNFACFGNYTIPDPTSGKDWDGTIFA